jgi:hypothetical protein
MKEDSRGPWLIFRRSRKLHLSRRELLKALGPLEPRGERREMLLFCFGSKPSI